jgi:hypothetical protein
MAKTGAEGNPLLEAMEDALKLKETVGRIESKQRLFAERLTKIEKRLGIENEVTR